MRVTPPAITAILETSLYYTEEPRTEAFYSGILGLQLIGRELGRHLFFRLRSGVLLLFRAEATKMDRHTAHGATGSVHVCFLAARPEYERWKAYLPARGVPIEHEVDWGAGRSFYFRDPDRNLLEIADADIWQS